MRARRLLLAALLACTALPAAALDGRGLYLHHCAPCHGIDGRGGGPDAALFVLAPRDLHEGFLARYPTDALIQRLLDGRALPLALDVPAMRRRAADVETLIAYLQRLPAIDWRAVDPGRLHYDERCATCHGFYGTPPASLPPGVRPPRRLDDPALQALGDAGLVEVVRHGRAGMPALAPRLDAADAAQVAAFVRLLSPGFTTYDQYCAACHGDHGIPNPNVGDTAQAPTRIFDRAYFARHDPEALRGTVWHMLEEHQPAMPHFRGVLSPAEAEAIVTYLRRAAGTPSLRE